MKYKWILTPKERKYALFKKKELSSSISHEFSPCEEFSEFCNQAYLARAVSSVPPNKREELDKIYKTLIDCVSAADITPNLPVELGNIDKNQINPLNHDLLLRSKFIIPLTYAVSDGRGWEMGFSYGYKLLVPILTSEQYENPKGINQPTLRLPFQIPVVFDNQRNLIDLLKELKEYEIGFGEINGRKTVLGEKGNKVHDLREVASRYVKVINYLV